MSQFHVEIRIMPRPALLDPQGQAVEHALTALGFTDVAGVRIGQAISLQLDRPNRGAVETDVQQMCERLLANPVTQDFTITISDEP